MLYAQISNLQLAAAMNGGLKSFMKFATLKHEKTWVENPAPAAATALSIENEAT